MLTHAGFVLGYKWRAVPTVNIVEPVQSEFRRKRLKAVERYGLLENPCECAIEPPCFVSHEVSSYTQALQKM